MSGLAAGDLRWRIAIQRFTTTTLPSGEEQKLWSELTKRWADISFGGGRERREAAQETASAPATFMVRADSVTKTITPADRIAFEGADWDIVSAVPSRRFDAAIEITAVVRAA